jgi:tetratricopeptide (TPR) repeat protein
MMDLLAYHPAARSTPTLVGRKKILDQIQAAVERGPGAVVFYIPGAGGIGKTRLLAEILRLCREGIWKAEGGPLLAVEEPVDLYHTQTHSLEGLARAMGAVIGPEIRDKYFRAYRDELETLERKKPDLRYALREITELRGRMTQSLIEGFQQLAQSYRVVIAFDTAEMLLYETDAVQQVLRLGAEGVGARRWLIEGLLPNVSNTVFLIAGRPRPSLLKDLRDNLGERLQVIELDRFSEDETLAYFDEVATAARADNEEDVAQRIENIPVDVRTVMHLLADGRPILLSLMMDLVALAQRLPDDLKIPLAQAREIAPGKLQAIRTKLESSIVSQFQHVGSPADEAIRSLAFARKGMDPVLLARVADMEEEEARQVLSALTGLRFNGRQGQAGAISGLRRLSFIKVRPADRRVFLHDEMYALLERHVLQQLPEADVKRAQRAILDYYAQELEETPQKIEALQPIVREEITPDQQIISVPRPATSPGLIEERMRAETYLDYLMSEEVHYLLRYDPLQGFQTYCRYAERAYESSDQDLDMQLRDELLAFVQLPEHEGLMTIDGLPRAEVDTDAGVRWIRRNIIRKEYYQAVVIPSRLREEWPDLVARAGEVGEARLDVWEGMAQAYLGEDLARSEELLGRAIEVLRSARPEDEFHQWQRTLELANAYNGLGYLLLRRGRHRQATVAYQRALPLWRRLGKGYEAEHANTLNNLSWALAELGGFDDAIRHCMDGLDLRSELGARYPIALSYNTLGQIQTRNDQPHRARINCERALAIFRELEMMRGIGMSSIALAEACRRMAETEEVYFPEEQVDLLRQALQHAREAVAIFGPYQQWPDVRRKEPQVSEPARLVDALIELGCAYRDWVRLWPSYTPQPGDPDREKLAQLGEQALRQAAQLAGSQQPHRAVDALVNLAWLRYYVGDLDGVEAVRNEVQAMVSDEYRITEEAGPPSGEPDQPWHWVQLGKMHVLQGHIAFNRYFNLKESDPELAHAALKEAAEMYTLALAYDDLYGLGHMFRDMKRGEFRIYDRFRGLNVDDLHFVVQAVQATADTYHLGQPQLALLIDKWFGPAEDLE